MRTTVSLPAMSAEQSAERTARGRLTMPDKPKKPAATKPAKDDKGGKKPAKGK